MLQKFMDHTGHAVEVCQPSVLEGYYYYDT